MFNTIVGAIGAVAASRYGSSSDQMIQLLAAPAPALQHCLQPEKVSPKSLFGKYFIIEYETNLLSPVFM
jgi:hypothetical protein